jgi:hypothetical protein
MPITFVGVKHVFGRTQECLVTGEIVRPQSSNPDKVIYMLQLQFTEDNRREYLLGYVHGLAQSGVARDLNALETPHLVVPQRDLEDVLREAYARGWLSRCSTGPS